MPGNVDLTYLDEQVGGMNGSGGTGMGSSAFQAQGLRSGPRMYGGFPTGGSIPYRPDAVRQQYQDSVRQQYQKPEASTTETPVNPMEQSAYNAASKYNNELESGNTAETTRTLAQARDELSVGMQKEGEAAIGRGADAGLFRSRALESGKRNIAKLQGDLADKAFGRRNDAINTLSSTATRAAEGQRTLHLGTMAAANADQRTQIDAADQQARLRQAPYDRLMQMMELQGRYGDGLLGTPGAGVTAPAYGSGGMLGRTALPPVSYAG